MKRYFRLALTLTLAAFSTASLAHDPKLHKKQEASSPDCAQMKDMDMSKMDMNDPVMKAMHEKCKNATGHDQTNRHDDSHGRDMPASDKTTPAGKDKQ